MFLIFDTTYMYSHLYIGSVISIRFSRNLPFLDFFIYPSRTQTPKYTPKIQNQKHDEKENSKENKHSATDSKRGLEETIN